MSRYKVVPDDLRVVLYTEDEMKYIEHKIRMDEYVELAKGNRSWVEMQEEIDKKISGLLLNKKD